MSSTIKIPDKINVGYRERDGTYTGKLAYVIYFDEKGVLRKEKSWNSWRKKELGNDVYDNVPMDGFVLNKRVGGYSTGWNHRNTYVRVYDPRGFEFEITVENLLYILENVNSILGKGLDGKFVYGWDGKDLLLIPCDSPDYKEIKEYSDNLKNRKTFKGKDLITGATYLTSDNTNVVYMGRYDYHGHYSYKKAYFFYNPERDSFDTKSSIGNYILRCVDEKCNDNYADIFEKMGYYESYNPYDNSKDEHVSHTLDSFVKYVESEVENSVCINSFDWNYCNIDICVNNSSTNHMLGSHRKWEGIHYSIGYYPKDKIFQWTTYVGEYWTRARKEHQMDIRKFYQTFAPQWKKEYLKDGKLRRILYNVKE